MSFHADRVDAFFRTFAVSEIAENFEHTLVFEMDRRRSASLRQSFRHAINRDYLLGSEQNRAPDCHLPHRSATPDRHGIGGLDVALHHRLPARWENISEKQHLLIRQIFRHLDVRRIRERRPHIFRLAARLTIFSHILIRVRLL